MTRRFDRDDPELVPHRTAESFADLPLLAPAQSWPERPAVVESEQRGLALPESLEDRYAAWRKTDDGTAAYRWIVNQALDLVACGTEKLFIDRLAWEYRQKIRRPYNNSYRSLMVREMVDAHPVLRGCFEMRERRAS